MKKKFGTIYYSAYFVERVLSKASATTSAQAIEAVGVALRVLKGLDEAQEKNPFLTLSFGTDALRVYFRGQLRFYVLARKHRVVIFIPGVSQIAESKHLADAIKSAVGLFETEQDFISWILCNDEVDWLEGYISSNWSYEKTSILAAEVSHPRHIPGEIRQAVLTEFLSAGGWCPGVSGITKRHKLESSTAIEFDHILPHTFGGSNGFWNIQVLCAECNRKKRATAA